MTTDVYNQLVQLWRTFRVDTETKRFVLQEDEEAIQKQKINLSMFTSLNDYTSNKIFGQDDTSLHVGLIPIPYAGNLRKASIFILMLNPGLSPCDYFAEYGVEQDRNALIRNLRQENANDEYPHLFLDPDFAWHSGFEYWNKKFKDVAQKLAHKQGKSYKAALQLLAQNIACLELIPYHSKSFGVGNLINQLPSARVMIDYVRHCVIPKAERGEAIIIATRSVQHWELPEHENVIVYNKGETRSAHLTLNSKGGKAIAKHFDKHLGIQIEDSSNR